MMLMEVVMVVMLLVAVEVEVACRPPWEGSIWA